MFCCRKLQQNHILLSQPCHCWSNLTPGPNLRPVWKPCSFLLLQNFCWTIHRMSPSRRYWRQCSSLLSLQMFLETRTGHAFSAGPPVLSRAHLFLSRPLALSSLAVTYHPRQLSLPRYSAWLSWHRSRIAVLVVKYGFNKK